MRFTVAAVLAGLASVVTAHFQMQFPVPRGPFVEDEEPTFCDNYVHAVSNRSEFPLSGGFFTLNSEHPQWTIGVTVSTQQDPTSFNDFNGANNQTQFVLPFVQANGEGIFCFPLDLSNTNISGIENGANVTLQFQFNGGDGNLFQCTDLTLSNDFHIPSDISCSNGTSTSASGTSSGSSSAPSPTSTSGSNGASTLVAGGITGAVGVVAAFALSVL